MMLHRSWPPTFKGTCEASPSPRDQPTSATDYKNAISRYRAGVAVASILALLLVAFGIVEAVQLCRTIRERDRADRMTKL